MLTTVFCMIFNEDARDAKIVKKAIITSGSERLSPCQWPKIGRVANKQQVKKYE